MNEKEKLMSEIIMLAMKVQMETEHAVFIRFHGHVGIIDIEIVQSKDNWQDELARANLYTDKDANTERMRQVKEQLMEFVEEGVDTEQLEYFVEEIYHHTF